MAALNENTQEEEEESVASAPIPIPVPDVPVQTRHAPPQRRVICGATQATNFKSIEKPNMLLRQTAMDIFG